MKNNMKVSFSSQNCNVVFARTVAMGFLVNLKINVSVLNEISNVDNEQQYAININDIFYVTKGGGAGGSGVSFSGGFSGGFSGTARGTGIFKTLTVEDGGTTSLNGTFTVNGKTFTDTRINFVTGLTVTKNGSTLSIALDKTFVNTLVHTKSDYGAMTTKTCSISHTHSISNSPNQIQTGASSLDRHQHWHWTHSSSTGGMQ